MKKIVFLFLILISVSIWGQNLTMKELIALREMSTTDTQSFLIKKGLVLEVFEEENKEEFGVMQFNYNKIEGYNPPNYSFIKYFSEKYSDDERITIMSLDQKKFEEYQIEVSKKYGDLIFSGNPEGIPTKVYQGEKLTFIFEITSKGNYKNIQNLSIYTNKDYNQNPF